MQYNNYAAKVAQAEARADAAYAAQHVSYDAHDDMSMSLEDELMSEEERYHDDFWHDVAIRYEHDLAAMEDEIADVTSIDHLFVNTKTIQSTKKGNI
jgi:hypothetical protein